MSTSAFVRCILFSVLAVLSVAFTPSLVAAQQNLVENGEFDINVDGWPNAGNAVVDWSSFDVDDAGDSGSLLTEFTFTNGAVLAVGQCLEFAPVAGAPYVLSGSVFMPTGQNPGHRVYLELRWRVDSECVGDIVQTLRTVDATPSDAWETLEVEGIAPAGAGSTRVNLFYFFEANEPLTAYVDHVVVVPEPADSLLYASAFATLAMVAASTRRNFSSTVG